MAKVWIEKELVDSMASILLNAHKVNHLFGRHLKRLDIIARMVGGGEIETSEDVARISAALVEISQMLDSAKHSLKRSNRKLS